MLLRSCQSGCEGPGGWDGDVIEIDNASDFSAAVPNDPGCSGGGHYYEPSQPRVARTNRGVVVIHHDNILCGTFPTITPNAYVGRVFATV